MTLAFWDSSALVKLLIEESGTDVAVVLWDESARVVASRLAVPEMSAALAAGERGGRVDRARARVARNEWHRYLAALDVVEISSKIAEDAADLAMAHPLSGADAVHLATALALRDGELVLATWDRRLAAAAVAEGCPLCPAISSRRSSRPPGRTRSSAAVVGRPRIRALADPEAMAGLYAERMERELAWDGCRNVRELGGLPVVGGGTTAWGRVVRADNPARLTASGWLAAFLLLALAGVPAEVIAEDWTRSLDRMAGDTLAESLPPGPVLEREGVTPLAAVEAAIATDVEARLLAGGLSPSDLTAARARLME